LMAVVQGARNRSAIAYARQRRSVQLPGVQAW
jgi:hypothetical protein